MELVTSAITSSSHLNAPSGYEHNLGGANTRWEKIGISNRDFDMSDEFEMMSQVRESISRPAIENSKCADKKAQISEEAKDLGDRGEAEMQVEYAFGLTEKEEDNLIQTLHKGNRRN
ncbi:hypothetical protein U1Q18_015408 [Sarracenia purpurea var. burkii]